MSRDTILIIVLGAVAYIILTTKQTATGTATGTATATEKAYQASCDYLTPLTLPWFACKTGAYPKPSNTPGTEHSPQTPPPKPTPTTTAAFSSGATCPENPMILAGDRRCGMQTAGNQTLSTGINPFTGEPWIPTGGFL